MPVLYKITEQQVLASAGLDAYVVSSEDTISPVADPDHY
jgi:hypothetical protein